MPSTSNAGPESDVNVNMSDIAGLLVDEDGLGDPDEELEQIAEITDDMDAGVDLSALDDLFRVEDGKESVEASEKALLDQLREVPVPSALEDVSYENVVIAFMTLLMGPVLDERRFNEQKDPVRCRLKLFFSPSPCSSRASRMTACTSATCVANLSRMNDMFFSGPTPLDLRNLGIRLTRKFIIPSWIYLPA